MKKKPINKARRRKLKRVLGILFSLMVLVFGWTGLGLIIYHLPPSNYWLVSGVLALMGGLVFLTSFVFSSRAKLSFWLAFFLTALLGLQLFRQLHWLNLVLLTAFCFLVGTGFRLDRP
ncbi:MAG: hypothetical protein ABID04_01175 [Patescibacteria group bacterium]